MDSAESDDLDSLSIKELRAQCALMNISTEGCTEKADLVDAIRAAAASVAAASSAAPMDLSLIHI